MDGYYPYPYSYPSLPPHLQVGLAIIASLACLSLFIELLVMAFICHRLILWHRSTKTTGGFNQCVILVFNLLLADFNQALAMVISLHWHQINAILAPTGYCWAQGAMLNFGNFASGSFVFAIALHTSFTILRRREVDLKYFTGIIISIWVVAVVVSIAGPLRHGSDFYTRAGNWCWISQKYELARLLLHYLWIFIFQFGTILIYAGLFIYIHRTSRKARKSSGLGSSNSQVTKAARYMIIYPIVYLIGTLPIAVGRMLTLAGHSPSDRYFICAGCLLTSCGWVDGLVYAFTRKVFVNVDSAGRRYPRHWSRSQEHKSSDSSSCHMVRSITNNETADFNVDPSCFNDNDVDREAQGLPSHSRYSNNFASPGWSGQSIPVPERLAPVSGTYGRTGNTWLSLEAGAMEASPVSPMSPSPRPRHLQS